MLHSGIALIRDGGAACPDCLRHLRRTGDWEKRLADWKKGDVEGAQGWDALLEKRVPKDILQATTQVQALFIDGKPMEPTSKQTKLYERYCERLKEVKEGRAPIGTK